MKQGVAFGAYTPDNAPFQTAGLIDMANAYPIANGYSPVGQFSAITPALPTTFKGGAAFVGSDENGTLIAGSSSNLYRFTGGSWTSVIAGLSAIDRWQFTQFGDAVVAVNGGPTQTLDLVANTAGVLTGAPTATSVATVSNFVVYGGAGGNAALVQWSGFNNQNDNTSGVNQSGYQPMLDGGDVKGIAGGEYGLIIQRSTVRKMTYIGDTTTDTDVIIPFQFDVLSPDTGAITAGSIAQSGRRVYFLSDRGFMFCDGTDVTPIGNERVDATFFALHGRDNLDVMSAAIDPRRFTVAWLIPGTPGRVWIYNWALDRWSIIEVSAKGILAGFTTNVSLESLDTLYPGGLETIPYSLDDVRFAGGDPLLLVIDPNGEFGYLSGPNMPARFAICQTEMIPGARTRMRWLRPVGDAISGVTAAISAKQRLGDVAASFTTATLNDSGDMPTRVTGRYIGTTINYAAGADWSFVQGLEFTIEKGEGR